MAQNWPPKKNVAFTMGFFIMKSDGTIIANPTLTGSNVHTDLGTTEVTNSTLAVVDSTTGLCSIALAQGTMNGDQIDGTITSSSTGAVVYTFKIMTAANTLDEIGARLPSALTANGNMKSSLVEFLTTALTETSGGLIAAAFKKFFDKASPTGTINSIPDAVAGANGGLPTTNGTKVSQTVDLTAGQTIAANLTQILGTALTETAGYIAAGFKKFFNVATPVMTAESVNQGADNNVILANASKGLAKVYDDMSKPSVAQTITAPTDMALASKLLKYFQLMFRKDAAIKSDNSTEFTAINADGGSGAGSYDNVTDSVQALRDDIPVAVEQHIINETDGEAVLTAITNKIAAINPTLGELSLSAIAAAVRTNLATELGHINADVTSRSSHSAADIWAVAARTLTSGGGLDAAGVRAAIGMALANFDTQIGAIPTTAMRGTDNAATAVALEIVRLLVAAIKTKTDLLGNGDIAHEFIVVDSDGPIDGAEVWATTDADGVNRVESGFTNSLGSYTFHLAGGYYYFWASHSGNYRSSVRELVA